MGTSSRQYMKTEEFKARQSSFEFFCAQAYEYLVEFRKDCRAGWGKLFGKPSKAQSQMKLDFIKNIADWANWTAEKNLQISFEQQG